MRLCSVIPAAGLGRRLGADKALVTLDGEQSAIERIVAAHRRARSDAVLVVRRSAAEALPQGLDVRCVALDAPPEMIDSLRAGLRVAGEADWFVHHPVDYPLAGDGVLHALRSSCERATAAQQIVLPLCGERPGHPIAFRAAVAAEILDAGDKTLREVIRRDPDRVAVVPTDNPWVHRDLDTPSDLASARAYLRRPLGSVAAIQRAHRSRRAFAADDVPQAQLEWLVDCARRAATSSMMQAYAVVAVRDAERRAAIAALCSDQAHVREAPVFLAICADLHKIERACARFDDREFRSPDLELLLQATIDASLLAQNLQLGAESEGLGACMIGAARNRPVELAALLGLPRRCYVAFGMVLGIPVDDPVPRERMALDAVLHRERYEDACLDAALDGADDAMRAWAVQTNAARVDPTRRAVDTRRGWTDRMAWLWGRPDPAKARAGLADALRTLGFDALG